jgi:DHA2 family multidrug resistance protein
MFIFGCGLYVSTALLPLYMQTVLGYTATISGLAISPGGLVVMAMMPMIGWFATKSDARILIGCGMVIISYSLYRMGYFSPLIGFWTIVTARIIQSFGLGFVFVPVNTLAYAYIGRDQRNAASGLINLARNTGAGVGIALSTALIQRRSQFHQVSLSGHVTPFGQQVSDVLAQLTAYFTQTLGDPVAASERAMQVLYEIVQHQARALAFVDAFRYAAVLMLLVVPVVFFMKRPPRPPQPVTPPPRELLTQSVIVRLGKN